MKQLNKLQKLMSERDRARPALIGGVKNVQPYWLAHYGFLAQGGPYSNIDKTLTLTVHFFRECISKFLCNYWPLAVSRLVLNNLSCFLMESFNCGMDPRFTELSIDIMSKSHTYSDIQNTPPASPKSKGKFLPKSL